jgi:hypothetical protein
MHRGRVARIRPGSLARSQYAVEHYPAHCTGLMIHAPP